MKAPPPPRHVEAKGDSGEAWHIGGSEREECLETLGLAVGVLAQTYPGVKGRGQGGLDWTKQLFV